MVLLYALLSALHGCLLHALLSALHGCLIPYINPRKKDCHQLPQWGRLKGHRPSYMVLVIDDNPYGLMFVLSILQVCLEDVKTSPI